MQFSLKGLIIAVLYTGLLFASLIGSSEHWLLILTVALNATCASSFIVAVGSTGARRLLCFTFSTFGLIFQSVQIIPTFAANSIWEHVAAMTGSESAPFTAHSMMERHAAFLIAVVSTLIAPSIASSAKWTKIHASSSLKVSAPWCVCLLYAITLAVSVRHPNEMAIVIPLLFATICAAAFVVAFCSSHESVSTTVLTFAVFNTIFRNTDTCPLEFAAWLYNNLSASTAADSIDYFIMKGLVREHVGVIVATVAAVVQCVRSGASQDWKTGSPGPYRFFGFQSKRTGADDVTEASD